MCEAGTSEEKSLPDFLGKNIFVRFHILIHPSHLLRISITICPILLYGGAFCYTPTPPFVISV